ncbi:MAG: dTDP-4-dehydrorhamnose 3,5-epimerase [Pseudomonadota bacterium]
MEVEQTGLPGVLVLTPTRHGDHRGFFSESWNRQLLEEHGISLDFVQDNHSLSAKAGTLRGLHFQAPPFAQDKLVRCGRGSLYDAVVDARVGSPTYGQSFGIELSFENGKQLLVPAGFLHGFVTLQADTEIVYKCSNYYDKGSDGSVRWDSCGIDWPVNGDPVLSEKDETAVAFAEFSSPFDWETVS